MFLSTLEKNLGVRLFHRTGKNLQLTPIGREYVRYAERFYAVKNIIDKWDRTAFVIASETKEVYGEGFLNDPRYPQNDT